MDSIANYGAVTEDNFADIAPASPIEQKETVPQTESKEGVKQYPILDFDETKLTKLSTGVKETLKHSKVNPAGGKIYEAVKRTFDIVASVIAIILIALPMLFIMLLIYLEDKGNPIFVQERLTKDGKIFRMYKLRSMCMDAEKKFKDISGENQSDGLAFKSKNDSRITRIGHFIRKTSIDELPQFFNVLKGDMSLIGPRPPLPREVVLYTPDQMDRLLVKGGLSCICQTEGRSDMPFDDWVESDVRYIQTRSFRLDVLLMIKTFLAVILKKGAR